MKIYTLTIYEYDTYSYSGISEQERFLFLSRQSAETAAAKMGLKIVEYCKDVNTEATIDEDEARP